MRRVIFLPYWSAPLNSTSAGLCFNRALISLVRLSELSRYNDDCDTAWCGCVYVHVCVCTCMHACVCEGGADRVYQLPLISALTFDKKIGLLLLVLLRHTVKFKMHYLIYQLFTISHTWVKLRSNELHHRWFNMKHITLHLLAPTLPSKNIF